MGLQKWQVRTVFITSVNCLEARFGPLALSREHSLLHHVALEEVSDRLDLGLLEILLCALLAARHLLNQVLILLVARLFGDEGLSLSILNHLVVKGI